MLFLFLLTRPSRGATATDLSESPRLKISTHTPLAGRDVVVIIPFVINFLFLLTRPSRGATPSAVGASCNIHISTHTPLAGRDRSVLRPLPHPQISTHTPLAGRDVVVIIPFVINFLFLLTRPSRGATPSAVGASCNIHISTHTPLAGRDVCHYSASSSARNFYSHAPRGARLLTAIVTDYTGDFYSHAPRGARRGLSPSMFLSVLISTHTPLAGRDGTFTVHVPVSINFYSHAPRGARLKSGRGGFTLWKISTHTPLAGRDSSEHC